MPKPSKIGDYLFFPGLGLAIFPGIASLIPIEGANLQVQLAGIGMLVAAGVIRIDDLLHEMVYQRPNSSEGPEE